MRRASVLVNVDIEPDGSNATWLLEGPSGFSQPGLGDDSFFDVEPGFYTITWQDQLCYGTPSPAVETLEVLVGETITFLGNYASFFWPLVMVKSPHLQTLPIGMLYFEAEGGGGYGRQTELMMSATVMNILPLIVLFVILQKYLVRGIQLGAVKG